MLAGEDVEVHDDLQEALLFAIERARNALLEANLDIFSFVGSILGVNGKGPDVRGRLIPGVLERAAFDGATPHVVVDGVRRSLGRLHRNAVLSSPVDFFFTGVKFPIANGSENLKLRVEGLDGGFEANLVVALAGAAMGDVLRTVLVCSLDHVLGEQRTRKRGKQRVGVLVEAVGGKRLGEVLAGVFLAHIHGLGSDCAALERLVLDVLEVGFVLTDVAANSDNVEVLFNLQPLQAARGVQTAGVCEYNFFFLSHGCASHSAAKAAAISNQRFLCAWVVFRPRLDASLHENGAKSLRRGNCGQQKTRQGPGVVMRPIVLRQKIRDYLIRTADNTRARRSVFRRLWRRREALVKLKNIAQLLSLVSSLQAMIAGFPATPVRWSVTVRIFEACVNCNPNSQNSRIF